MQLDKVRVVPAVSVAGDISMPGDKSISHRLAMLGGLARGTTTIQNFATSSDSHSTLSCLERLGVSIEQSDGTVTVHGMESEGLRQPLLPLNAENSGTTVRLLSGIVAGFPIETTFVGDASLSQRPMRRVIEPLRQFGATLTAREDNFLPLSIHGDQLHAIEYRLPVASAQVKSAVLLAGLSARGRTRIIEPVQTRNHTELALQRFGAQLQARNGVIEIEGGHALKGIAASVPGDLSSAAFFVAAALGLRESRLRIQAVGLNPTRSGFITLLQGMGATITLDHAVDPNGEPAGDVVVETSDLKGGDIGGHWIANIIDEIPVLCVLATRTREGMRIRDAAELRAKETDRIRSVVDNLRSLDVEVTEFEDGLFVPGNQQIRGGTIDSFGDHRIAMAFAVAGLFATDPVTIKNASCVGVSFPGFFELLNRCQTSSSAFS